jgi:hypothetical protein
MSCLRSPSRAIHSFCLFFPGTHTHGQASSFFFVKLATRRDLVLPHSAPPCARACCPCVPVYAASYAQACTQPWYVHSAVPFGCAVAAVRVVFDLYTGKNARRQALVRASTLPPAPCRDHCNSSALVLSRSRRAPGIITFLPVDSGGTSCVASRVFACPGRVTLVALDGRIQFARGSHASERPRGCLTTSQPPPFLYRRSTRRAGITFSWSCAARSRLFVRCSRASPSER